MASFAASSVPGSSRPIGGELRWVSGSATPQKIRPIPMPVANIIDTHENVENSGWESSCPSLMFPYRLSARYPAKRTKNALVRTKSQPKLPVSHTSALEVWVEKVSGRRAP
jgi:hypothetical protein